VDVEIAWQRTQAFRDLRQPLERHTGLGLLFGASASVSRPWTAGLVGLEGARRLILDGLESLVQL